MSHTKKTSRNGNNKNTNSSTESDSLSPALKNKIKDFKEVFPRYKQSTNADILAIFEEFNNDYNAAVYGVLNGLVKSDCTESWQTAGQKKKKVKNTSARGKSVTPKNRTDYGDRRAANSNRGQSASRASSSSSRGGRNPSNSSRDTTAQNDTKQPQPPRVAASKPTPAAAVPPPNTNAAPPRQSPPSSVPQPSASASKPVTERLSYANVAKSRQAWNPNNTGKTAPPAAQPQNPVPESKPQQPKVEESPVSSIPPNVQSIPAPSQPIASAANPFNAPKPAPERQPRVGVLLPGNFTSDDSMSFQFGNLGLLEEEKTTTSEPEITKSKPSAPQSSASRVPRTKAETQPEMPKMGVPPEMEAQMGMPMNQYSPYPMYPVGMEGVDPATGGRPMPFYPEQYPTHAYSRGDGKYPRGGGNSNLSGRDSSSTKFNADNGDKTSSATQAAAQQTAPYPYGPYPMYGHPFVNQFHGGSYGNQFYPGFYKNPPGFPPGGYQNYGNTGMGYAQSEDEYRQKMAGQYYSPEGGNPMPTSSAPQASKSASQTSPPKQGLEGGYQSAPGFKNQATGDYYQDMYMGSSFATPQPFGYPPMGQQGYPPQQPQQPQPQQSSQSSSSQNRNY